MPGEHFNERGGFLWQKKEKVKEKNAKQKK